MIDNPDQLHAGCVGAQDTDAGCVQGLGEAGPVLQAPPDNCSSTGCAAPVSSYTDDSQAIPPRTLREFERALRALGFSRPQAQAIARQGFSGAAAPSATPPEADDSERLRKALERLAHTLKGSP